ncbi:MAG TPA: hypothetical protein VKM54_28260 [Myxococcota bacterium]|nr:hypothetical protein [Myxococcota bacterium]
METERKPLEWLHDLFGEDRFRGLSAEGDLEPELETLWLNLRWLRLSLGADGFGELLADVSSEVAEGGEPVKVLAGVLADYL